jgi:anti-sigma regulatory factor (Ser/Thr protein kinase)
MEVEQRFSPDPANVRRARTFVVDALVGTAVDEELVRLLTSELATNAVLHAESEFRVRVRADPMIVRVEVINSEPELLLAMREPSGQGGRGLHLVKELSVDWGAESFRDEKVVWFEVPASGAEAVWGGRIASGSNETTQEANEVDHGGWKHGRQS